MPVGSPPTFPALPRANRSPVSPLRLSRSGDIFGLCAGIAIAYFRAGLTDGLSFNAKAACPRCDVVYALWKQLG